MTLEFNSPGGIANTGRDQVAGAARDDAAKYTTVHLLDVQRALGRTPEAPEAGLACTAAVIARIAPAIDLIEAATGRASTDLFPVLS
ncbi:hypothetical protein [Actinoplanes sp. NPDC026619]|uniref:hypothetical protein n=1 Tax=Actinoplanes sp. NPDC026619 TaxID=3155798 RepID=UPI0033FB8EDE